MAVLLLLLTALTGEADSPPDSANPQELACGPSSLSVAARLLGREVSPSELAGVTEGGLDRIYSLEELRVAAGRLGFETMPARCSPEFLTRVDAPMIVAVDGTNSNPDGAHFVVGRQQDSLDAGLKRRGAGDGLVPIETHGCRVLNYQE